MSQITRITAQKRNPERVNIELDGEFAFSLSALDAVRLRTGQVLSPAEIEALRGADTIQRAVDSAARFLSFRPRSLAEVRRNLKEKEFPPQIIEAALERLTTLGYLDDTAFAQFWVQNRAAFKPLSRKALRYELARQGVSNDVIDNTLETATDESELAYRAAQKYSARWQPMPRLQFKQKLLAFLQRRGFTYNIARSTIDRLGEERAEQGFFTIEDDLHED